MRLPLGEACSRRYDRRMAGFTTLELQALEAMAESQSGPAPNLAALLETAIVTSRENTGFGFFTRFEVDRSRPPVARINKAFGVGEMILAQLTVELRGKVLLMSFILHRDASAYPVCLEGYQAAALDATGKVVDGYFDLRDDDLAALVANRS